MKVKYTGLWPKGTLHPRPMWWPGDFLDVDDNVAEELLRERGFMLLKPEKPKKPMKAEE